MDGDSTPSRVPWAVVLACLAVAFTSGGVVVELHTLTSDVADIKQTIGLAASNSLRLAAVEAENKLLIQANDSLNKRMDAIFVAMAREGNRPIVKP